MPHSTRDLMRKWMQRCWSAAALLLPLPLYAQPVPEYELKAAFVYNFVRFTDWPPDTVFEGGILNICVTRYNMLHQSLLRLSEKTVNGRRIAVRQLSAGDVPRTCHVLLIDANDRDYWKKNKKDLAMANVLTISDGEEIAADGSIISLETSHNRIVFDIDMRAASKARMVLSSKLLRLARTVQ